MSEDKPLHVRVAEALGCKPIQGATTEDGLFCDCEDCAHCPGRGEGWGHACGLSRYDLDWSATGPLIERFRMCVGQYVDDIETYRAGKWYAVQTATVYDTEYKPIEAIAPSPLRAVCALILKLKAEGKLPTD